MHFFYWLPLDIIRIGNTLWNTLLISQIEGKHDEKLVLCKISNDGSY